MFSLLTAADASPSCLFLIADVTAPPIAVKGADDRPVQAFTTGLLSTAKLRRSHE